MTYYTDGLSLYEVAADRSVRNYGLRGGVIRALVLRDVCSDQTGTVGELELLALREVRA